uniref:Venom dipeptidyl peptidase 4 n=1 Tax=Timema monikensis TaxID=170555 RepID=A0A7R9EEP9_9NEOP|nr:unnamed protein product [Timema monikensis]
MAHEFKEAGTTNPTAILWAVDLNHPSQLEPVALKPSQAVSSTEDYYFTAVTWLTGHQVGVVWMNRRQNVSTISICRGTAWTCEDVVCWGHKELLEKSPRSQLCLKVVCWGKKELLDKSPRSQLCLKVVCWGKKELLDKSPRSQLCLKVMCWGKKEILAKSPRSQLYLKVVCWGKRSFWPNLLALSYTYTERSGERGWVEVYQPPLFSSDGSSYLVRLPVLDGNNGFYKHVVHVNVATKQVTPLTHGKFEVTEILKWDEERNLVYFLAAPENKSGERHLCRARDLNSTLRFWDCLTCPQEQMTHAALVVSETTTHPTATIPTSQIYGSSVSNGSGSGREWEPMSRVPVCLYSVPKFSMGPSPRFFALECLGPDPPSVSLVEVSSNTRILTLDSYSIWRERFHSMAAPQIKTFKVQVDVGVHAQVRLHLPPGFREKEEMTFPLVLHVCGAPGSQLVSERWGVDWGTYLASSRNFIVAEIDGRGSGFQGDSFLHKLRHHLGSTEVADQIVVIKWVPNYLHTACFHLKNNLNFIDKEKIAVWGWSYGGFAAAMILAEDTEVFCCGISVAPITSWAHYDSVYTERYMGTPNVTDNYLGYEQSDITKRAGNLKEKEFLLIHGTADDTVHYQQSMMLVKALTEEGVLFRHLTYPDEGHTFSGVQQHLYKAMEAFLDDCFGPLDFEEWEGKKELLAKSPRSQLCLKVVCRGKKELLAKSPRSQLCLKVLCWGKKELLTKSPSSQLCLKVVCWGRKELLAISTNKCCETCLIFEWRLATRKPQNDNAVPQ